jgi:hypothetical protein
VKGFFEWLLTADEPTGDRRRSPRYPAVPNRARLAWREGGRTREATARLVNISGVGAFVLGPEMPAAGAAVRIRLEVPAVTDWVEARAIRRASSGKLGLDFAGSCPYDVFKAATHGVPREIRVPPEFADGYWR